MTYTPPEDEFENIARLWQAHDSIIDSCERGARRYGLDPELTENLVEDLREADAFPGSPEMWQKALANMFQALFKPRDNH